MRAVRGDLPSGTVTLLFTDIEGSTKLLHELGAEAYARALLSHRRALREAFARHGGVEVDTQGDAFFFAFPAAAEALQAAREAQEVLAQGPIHVRMGLHTGRPHLSEEGYVGPDVHMAARIAASGHGGQVLLSKEMRQLVDLEVTDLGEHRVKDFDQPVWIFQLGSERFPPLKTISNTNLPRPASSFVGREKEIREVVSLVRDSARLITLTGPGGSGKTRLAIEAAAEVVPEFKSGVFWVGLAPLRDPVLVTESIGRTLGAKDGLADHIGERELLLLCDNLEQVIDAAPELATLVEACPNLKVLVTSRELLRVRGEVEYPVLPLAEPEGVDLFCARARTAPDGDVRDLCRALDNLPLALELAAARTKVLTPAQILERISSRLDLLKGGRDADPRQRTLRATIEWSYELLTDPEKALFARLSVFRGGCTLASAEQVAEADLDRLQSLVEKSLLRHRDDRFWMLETIREFATERLGEVGEAGELRRRHAEAFLSLAEEVPPHLGQAVGAASKERLDRLEAEHDNLRAALDWFEETGQGEREQRLAGALLRFWQIRGHYPEARRRLEHAIQADPRPTHARAWALFGAAVIGANSGDPEGRRLLDQASAIFDEALTVFNKFGDTFGIARVRMNLGAIAMDRGDFERGRELFEESVRSFEQLGDEHWILFNMRMLAWANFELGDIDRARELHQEVVPRARKIGASHIEGSSLGALGEYATYEGRLEEAVQLLKESMGIYLELKDPEYIAASLCRFARVLALSGSVAAAAQVLARAEALYLEIGRTIDRWLVTFNDETRTAIRDRLDEAAMARAAEEGRKLTVDEAVALALERGD
jgi:predicted ATPase/class 3 adenylate cyclase